MNALVVTGQWVTDQGPVQTRRPYTDSTAIVDALRDMAQELDERKFVIVRLARCYTQEVPLVDGQVCWPLAGPMQRVLVNGFQVIQYMEDAMACKGKKKGGGKRT